MKLKRNMSYNPLFPRMWEPTSTSLSTVRRRPRLLLQVWRTARFSKSIRTLWVCGHRGVKGQEIADELTKSGRISLDVTLRSLNRGPYDEYGWSCQENHRYILSVDNRVEVLLSSCVWAFVFLDQGRLQTSGWVLIRHCLTVFFAQRAGRLVWDGLVSGGWETMEH